VTRTAAFTAVLSLALVAACSERPSRPVPAAPFVDGPVRQRGTLLVRDTTMTFVACGTTTERALTAPPSSQLEAALASVNGGGRDSLYVEVIVDTSGGALAVRETLFAESMTAGSRCDRPRRVFDVEATGNEPFWHVTLDSAQLVLERPEPPRELVFDASPGETRGALTTIHARRSLGTVHDLTLGLLREPCRDGMSDAWYPYRAEVRFGDVALHGCARR
jgi:uncharacterized membrane protein